MAERSWAVTSQATGQVTVNQAGNVTEGVQVYFVTGDGNEGSVFVSNAQYNVATVHALVDEAAKKLDAVGQLALNPGQGG